ncbi:MAG: hypothetical protein ACO3FT_08290, partial [Ilumatobacteraceae bacterium]
MKLNKAKPKTNPYTGQPYAETFFVSLRHNNHPWQFVGRLRGHTIVPTATVAHVWAQPEQQRAIRIAQWGVHRIVTQTDVPQGYRLAHTGRCGKCGKLLR